MQGITKLITTFSTLVTKNKNYDNRHGTKGLEKIKHAVKKGNFSQYSYKKKTIIVLGNKSVFFLKESKIFKKKYL